MAIKNAAVYSSKIFVSSWINSYGVAVSAFAGISLKINSIINRLSYALATAGTVMIGQNIGARKFERVSKIFVILIVISLIMAATLITILLIFPEEVFGIFTNDKSVLQIGMMWLPIAVVLFFGSSLRVAMDALIDGCGLYKIKLVIALLDGIILRIGLALLFGITFDMRYLGFWLGDALAGFAPFIIGSVLYFSGRWKKNIK